MQIQMVEGVPLSELKKLLPEDRFRQLDMGWETVDSVLTVAAMDDEGRTRGVCIFVTQSYSLNQAILFHIFVNEEFRNQKIATDMLKQGTKQLKSWGYENIVVPVLRESSADIFEKTGFIKFKPEFVMFYSGDILLSSKIGRNLGKFAHFRKNVRKEQDLSATEKKRFRQVVMNSHLQMDLDEVSGRHTRYYVDNNEHIVACLPVLEDDGDILIQNVYMEKVPAAKMALPCMFVDVLYERTQKGLMNDDTEILATISSEQNVAAMSQGFGEPRKIMASNVLIKKL